MFFLGFVWGLVVAAVAFFFIILNIDKE